MIDRLEGWLGAEFQDPAVLWLTLLVPLAWLVRVLRGAPRLAFAPFTRLADVRGTWRTRLAAVPPLLQAVGLVLLVAALARPAERMLLPRETTGLDILLVLDVSSSMTERDLDPTRTRLDVARAAARTFAQGRPHDRVGLVAFARYADLVVPPTTDHRALAEALGALELVEHEGPEDATALGLATARAAEVLARGAAGARHKVAVLLTDGEENVHYPGAAREVAPDEAAQWAAAVGVRVHALAVGAGGRRRDGSDAPLDTRALEGIARATGGLFRRAEDSGAVDRVFAELGSLERAPLAQPDVRLVPRHLALLALGAALLLIARTARAAGLEVAP